MIVAYLSVVFFLVGLVVYVLASNPKAQEIGRCFMWCGLLAALFAAHATVRIG